MDEINIPARRREADMHGVTWRTLENAYLDELQHLYTERRFAFAELAQFAETHPRLVDDDHFIRAVMALR